MYRLTWVEDNEEYERIVAYYDGRDDGTVTVKELTPDDVSPEDVIQFIENKLEDENYHSLSDLPRDVFTVLLNHVDIKVAKAIMFELADRGVFIP